MPEALDRLTPLIFVLAFAALWAWEAAGTKRRTGLDAARRRRRNLAVSALNFVLGGAAAALLLIASRWITHLGWGLAALAAWPAGLTVLAGALAIDLTDYVRHRLSHRLGWLWRLHRVHHTDVRVDVTTSLRSHPLEQLLRPLFALAAILVFGISPAALAAAALVQFPILLFQHTDVRLPAGVDRALAWLIPTPALHRVHHSRDRPQTDTNYGTALTIWDRAFGSFHPALATPTTGLDGFDHPRHQTLVGMLGSPWRAPVATQRAGTLPA